MSVAPEEGRTVELQDFQKFAIWTTSQALWRRRGFRDPLTGTGGMLARILPDATKKTSKCTQRCTSYYPLGVLPKYHGIRGSGKLRFPVGPRKMNKNAIPNGKSPGPGALICMRRDVIGSRQHLAGRRCAAARTSLHWESTAYTPCRRRRDAR